MMKISILTLFPDLFEQFLQTSIIKRAQEKGLVEFNIINLFAFTEPKVRVDTPTAGPGPGMLLKVELIEAAILQAETQWGGGYKIFFTPKGKTLNQKLLRQLASQAEQGFSPKACLSTTVNAKHIILLCGRYEGFDCRVEQFFADLELSIGDYVLMGGELPAQVFLEGLLRLQAGVLGNADSLTSESFESPFFDHGEYAKPDEWQGMKIPEVLQSGNHGKINLWRQEHAAKHTIQQRFDWFIQHRSAKDFAGLAQKYIPPHYVAILHHDIKQKDGTIGTTSVKSLDLHDIARSACTYGFKNFFIVTPLQDQQAIIREFLSFWLSDSGKKYNDTRHKAVNLLQISNTYQEMINAITQKEGKLPLVIATCAQQHNHPAKISYNDQSQLFAQERPILILLGTGYGLSDEIISQSDYFLEPIVGLTNYNHLSVRAAASIIFDRWLGLHPKD